LPWTTAQSLPSLAALNDDVAVFPREASALPPEAVIRLIAADYGRIMSAKSFVLVRQAPEPLPSVMANLRARVVMQESVSAAKEAERLAVYETEEAERNRISGKKAVPLEKRLRIVPVPSEWKAITKEALAAKVTEMPITRLAALFGVSDVAVAKRCKKLGIDAPGRGYWAKKYAEDGLRFPPKGSGEPDDAPPRP
jgi:hypothetical protein